MINSWEQLKPAIYNPRQIAQKASTGLKHSLYEFGDISGIVWNKRSGNIVAGHQRVEALKKSGAQLHNGKILLGDREFSIRVVEWDDTKEKAANVAANNPHIAGDFTSSLGDLLGEIKAGIGEQEFSDLCLDDLLFDVGGETDTEIEEDEVPDPPKNPITKLGDVWSLGDHILVCDDSKNHWVEYRLMFTDPPYNIGGKNKLLADKRDSYKRLRESSWDTDFSWRDWVGGRKMPNNSSSYVCGSQHVLPEVWAWMEEQADCFSFCVWHKPNPMPSLVKRHWTGAAELIAYGTKGKHTFNFPIEGHASSVWNINKNPKNDLHPTQKPVAVPSHAITHSSNTGDLVFDPFGGSGTTLIACEQLSRKCYGVEIEPAYCDVVIERWSNLTGGSPIRKTHGGGHSHRTGKQGGKEATKKSL